MNDEEKRYEQRAEARALLRDAAAIFRELGDQPENAINDFVSAWLWDEPDERIDEHFYENLAKHYDVPLSEDDDTEDEDEETE